jgi:putative GTP pyrophosphokinase
LPEDPEKFTYSSLHFVCLLNEHRSCLGEYQKYTELKFEIQVRSILQHAWAEIEHDWYDLQNQLPAEIKRRFSRLAGLLDLADSEFLDIRKKKIEYERSVSLLIEAEVPDLSSVLLDELSIRTFASQEPLVRQLDSEIALIKGLPIVEEGPDVLNRHRGQLAMAKAAGLKTLQDLRSALTQYQKPLIEYVRRTTVLWSKYGTSASVARGACILNLSVMLVSKLGDNKAIEIFRTANLNVHPEVSNQLQVARDILAEMV